jgi:peptidyl-prolyl cis-trans isomerase SurA
MRRFAFLILSFAVCAIGLRVRAAELVDSIRVVVNDVPITQQEIEMLIGPDADLWYQRYSSNPDMFRRKITELRENASDFLVDREVILHDFRETLKVPDSIIDEIIQDRINEKFHNDNVALTKELEAEGITLEELKQRYRDEFIVEQMRIKYVPEPIISPLKIESYYTEHQKDFKVEDQVKLRMIVLNKTSPDTVESTRRRAEEILSQIKTGASFEELARSYSDGSQRLEGGESGWEDFSVLNKILADEINKLKAGQFSGVIDAPDGFYLLLLEDRHPEHFRPLNEVRDKINKELADEETRRLTKLWIERLKKKTFIKNF